jgi:AmpD protein
MHTIIDSSGWHSEARVLPSDNFDARPVSCAPELIVVHNISLPPGCFATGAIEALFCNRLDCSTHPFYADLEGLRVSAHFLIDRRGALTQFVSCDDRAWHAGVSRFAGRSNCNDFSVGIELEGTDSEAYEPAQYERLARLIRELRSRYATLGPAAVVGHSDIAPGRKTDPGPAFSWQRLRALLRSVDALPMRGLSA